MKILLDLKRHCIQTAAKRKYNHLISSYFKKNSIPADAGAIESEIALLKNALESLDFPRLRSEFPELRGGGADEIIMGADTDNHITLSINGRTIYAPYQNNKLL